MNQCALRHEVPSFELKVDYLARRCQVGGPLLTQPLLATVRSGVPTGRGRDYRGSLRSVGRYAVVSCTAAASEPNSPHMRLVCIGTAPRALVRSAIGFRFVPSQRPARFEPVFIKVLSFATRYPDRPHPLRKLSRSISGVLHLTWSDLFASRSFFASSTGTFPYSENRSLDN